MTDTCWICGRDLTTDPEHRTLVVQGGTKAVHPDEHEDYETNLGVFPVGPTCAKKNPDIVKRS